MGGELIHHTVPGRTMHLPHGNQIFERENGHISPFLMTTHEYRKEKKNKRNDNNHSGHYVGLAAKALSLDQLYGNYIHQ